MLQKFRLNSIKEAEKVAFSFGRFFQLYITTPPQGLAAEASAGYSLQSGARNELPKNEFKKMDCNYSLTEIKRMDIKYLFIKYGSPVFKSMFSNKAYQFIYRIKINSPFKVTTVPFGLAMRIR